MEWWRWENELMEKKIRDFLQKWILNIELRSCVDNAKTTVNNLTKWINIWKELWCTARKQYAVEINPEYLMRTRYRSQLSVGPWPCKFFPKWIFTRFTVATIVNYFVVLKITVYKLRKIIFFIWNESPPLSVTICSGIPVPLN